MNITTMPGILRTVGLLLIKDRRLLLAFSNNKQCFYLPGGKVDPHETATDALCREVAEELKVAISSADLEFYSHISAAAFGETPGTMMEQDCFLLKRSVDPQAGAEIGAIRFFSLAEYLEQLQQAPGAVAILQQLQDAGLID